MISRRSIPLLTLALLGIAVPAFADPNLALSTDIVSETGGPGSFPLLQNKQAATLYLDKGDFSGVLRVAADLQADIERVADGSVRGDEAETAPEDHDHALAGKEIS